MSRILIIGDSWGEGEWDYLCNNHLVNLNVCGCPPGTETLYSTSHRGLEKYLIDHGCYVENRSQGGKSNMGSLNRCKEAVNGRLDTFDYIFWFVTDPLRDFIPDDVLTAHSEKEIKERIAHYMDMALDRANKYGGECKTGVTTIGGLFSPDPGLVAKYENIHIGCHSFLELCGFDIPEGWDGFNEVPYITDKFLDLSDTALDYLEWKVDTYHGFMANREFYPPNEGHPNRKAHKILTEYLINKYNLTSYKG